MIYKKQNIRVSILMRDIFASFLKSERHQQNSGGNLRRSKIHETFFEKSVFLDFPDDSLTLKLLAK